jgi:hypothetical protein
LPQDVLSECRANLNYSVFHEIPNDPKTAKWVNNQGQIAPGHTALGKALESLAKRITGGEQLLLTTKDSDKGAAAGGGGGGFKFPAIFGSKKK